MDVGGISSGSVYLNTAKVQSQASTAVLKMSMDQTEQAGAALIQMMERSVNPNIGQNIDIRL